MSKLLSGFSLFVLVFIVGFWTVKPQRIPQRQIASIPEYINTDYSYLLNGSFKKAAMSRLLKDSYITEKSEDINIHLAHFRMRVDGQNNRSACEYFKTVQVKFQAEGVAISGEKPSLTLEVPCVIGQNNYMEPLKIPAQELLKRDSFLGSSIYQYDQTKISISDMDGWSPFWLMSEMSLIPQKESDQKMNIQLDRLPLQSSQKKYAHKLNMTLF